MSSSDLKSILKEKRFLKKVFHGENNASRLAYFSSPGETFSGKHFLKMFSQKISMSWRAGDPEIPGKLACPRDLRAQKYPILIYATREKAAFSASAHSILFF